MAGADKTAERTPFLYRDFYDVPRMVLFTIGGQPYLLDCAFDSAAGEYSDEYVVYRMPKGFHPPDRTWTEIPTLAEQKLGTMPVSALPLDPTRRVDLEAGALGLLIAALSKSGRT